MDREKVISALEEIKTQTAEIGLDSAVIAHKFIDKILALLKEQEAKIEQLNRFVNGFSRDAMPVARCKYCKWYDERISMCDNCGLPREQTFFCADGERKDS